MHPEPTLIPAWQNGSLCPVEKLEVHRRGLRHPAVSVFVTGPSGVLLQRRALGKYHTPGLWANTCCTHPNWGEAPATCAHRRLEEELGIGGLPLEWREQIEYRAEVGSGLIEHEVVEVYLGRVTGPLPLAPDPDEVAETLWMPLPELEAALVARPGDFTPWLRIYLADHREAILG